MALLRYAAKFDPFLSLDCAKVEGTGAQKGRDQILPSGNLVAELHVSLLHVRAARRTRHRRPCAVVLQRLRHQPRARAARRHLQVCGETSGH